MSSDLHQVSWDHPDKGRISEVVCHKHMLGLIGIFHALGIEGLDSPMLDGVCFPCVHDDLLDALRSLVADFGPSRD
jgi:hypothetical protein